jgi:predicted exporter
LLSSKALAVAWAVVVLITVAHQVWFWNAGRLDSDVLALLPREGHNPAVEVATRTLTDAASRQGVVLVGSARWEGALAASDAVAAALREAPINLDRGAAQTFDALVDFYRPWRDRLITPDQRERLERAPPEELGRIALMQLYQPAGVRFGEWRSDPLGLWPAWWAARAAETRARPREGRLWLAGRGLEWMVLPFESRAAGFSATGDTPISDAIARAREAASAVAPDAVVLAAGVPLFAEAAAARARLEMNVIGTGSLIAVIALSWLCFRSIRPIVLVTVSLLVGCGVALSVTAMVFDRVHLLTLVFGASLVGVAEDYGIHYFAARQGRELSERSAVLQSLLPGLLMALATSVVAYLALGLAPFPALRQMAVFSAVGLAAAFLTVVCWFPPLDRKPLPDTAFARVVAASLLRWPRWRAGRRGWLVLVSLGVLVVLGLTRLDSHDDLRQLQSAPPFLLEQQREVSTLLGLPSPAQYFLIEGRDVQELLQREEVLTSRLDVLVKRGVLTGYHALSDWLPSLARQNENAHLTAKAEAAALAIVARETGESPARIEANAKPLAPDAWRASPAASATRSQWLGRIGGAEYSVVMLLGVTRESLPFLQKAAEGLAGVQWVDRPADLSALMSRYRALLGALLVAGYVAVWAALAWRYGIVAWRVLLPTALGSLLTLALFGLVGVPFQLFTVLALLLLLGMGVDYGIFLMEHPEDGKAWLAVAVAGVSTVLAFGLLALSSTPALSNFGLTMLVGEILIWLLTPWFRAAAGPRHKAFVQQERHRWFKGEIGNED